VKARGQTCPNKPAGELAGQLQGRRGCMFRRKFVAILAEGKNGLDAMIAVGQFLADVQSQIQLCVGNFDKAAQGAAVALVRPLAILLLSRAVSSSSAVANAADQAKRASNRRPDVKSASPRCS